MNVKKFTSYAVALMMSVSLAPINANADNAVTNGYYNDSGQWVQGELDQTLPEGIHSVDKTAEALGNNTYRMKLKVVTKQNVETFTKKSATVLVVDTSNSMDGNRIRNLRAAAKEFVQSYAGDKENVGRYLAVVDFATDVKVPLNWTDVSSVNGKEAAKEAIDDLRARGGTNLDAGIKQATSLFLKDDVEEIQKANRNTVVLTDGKPTYYLGTCDDDFWSFLHTHIEIGGITYHVYGNGQECSEKNVEATSADAKLLRDQSTVYTVCYGAARDITYRDGPTVSEFLKGSIATSRDKAYDSSETDDLTKVFKAISESVTTGITGKDLEVFDGAAPFVSVSQLPPTVQPDASGFKWKLANATTTTEGTQTYYTYELEYFVTLDADHPDFKEGKLYPLNGETYIAMPDGSKVKFPVPGAKGIKSRYTVTYTDGVDGEDVFKDQVFPDLVVGTITPEFDGTPTRVGYTFTGWSPAVEEKVTKSITYNATWVMNWVPINAAPVINATDKTIEVGDEFDPLADVTATDTEDGNLTSKIIVEKNGVKTDVAGQYEVTYKVTDSHGATRTKTIIVTVNPKMEVLNEAPVIHATDKTITVGDTFDPKAGVTAKDAEDGDLTDKIEVVKNTVDTKKAGKYEVTYKVTDSDGATRTKTIKVTVKEKAPAPSTDKDKTPTTPNKDKDKTTTVAPKTGDTTSVNTIIALLAVSGIALLALLKRKKVS